MINLLISLIIYLLIVGILYWVAIYVIDSIPVPQPANRFIRIAITVLAVLIVVILLLQMFGVVDTGPLPQLRPR